jgi:hypothetical protein
MVNDTTGCSTSTGVPVVRVDAGRWDPPRTADEAARAARAVESSPPVSKARRSA